MSHQLNIKLSSRILQVPDGATVALIPRSQSSGGVGVNQVFQTGESKNTTHLNNIECIEHVDHLQPTKNKQNQT